MERITKARPNLGFKKNPDKYAIDLISPIGAVEVKTCGSYEEGKTTSVFQTHLRGVPIPASTIVIFKKEKHSGVYYRGNAKMNVVRGGVLAAYDEAKKLNLPALYCKHYNDVRLTPFASMPERRFTGTFYFPLKEFKEVTLGMVNDFVQSDRTRADRKRTGFQRWMQKERYSASLSLKKIIQIFEDSRYPYWAFEKHGEALDWLADRHKNDYVTTDPVIEESCETVEVDPEDEDATRHK